MVDQREALDKAIHDLPEPWKWEWFTDVMDVDGGTQPPASEFVDAPRPGYVRLVQIRDFESDRHLTYIPDSPKWRKCGTSDVLIARYGASLGRICTGLSGAYNVALAKVVPTERIHLPFAYHLLRSSYFQGPLLAGGGRSAQAGFNKDGLSIIPLPIPPISEQRAIAHILGTLDDKIELNLQMNETLEAIARALFKSWFVDFTPVRAKAEGRDPGLPKHIAKLFPDCFEDSELGEIPKGWKVGSILDHSRLISGGTPKTDHTEYWGGPISWASAKDVSQSTESFLVETERSLTQQGIDESATQIVPAFCSVVVARGATTGRMVLFGRPMAMNQTCYALASTTETPFALYCRLCEGMDALVHSAHGSVFDTITTSTFASSRIILPPPSALKIFEGRISALFHRMLNNVTATHTLAALRDTLLPKLISGELRVPAWQDLAELARKVAP